MDMYVRLFEDTVKGADDNPTVGIILCTEKDHTVVKYSVLNENRQLFASKYMLYLPTEEALRQELERERALVVRERQAQYAVLQKSSKTGRGTTHTLVQKPDKQDKQDIHLVRNWLRNGSIGSNPVETNPP